MPYVGSYTWKMRQKIGNDRIILPSVDTICVNDKGEILMVYNRDFDGWAFPGGSVEFDLSWSEAAAQEILEEASLVVDPSDLIPFASISGSGFIHEYADGSAQFFSMAFVAHKFSESNTPLDAGEISETKWFSLAEAEPLKKTFTGTRLFPAYKKWLETKQFQQIIA